MHRGSLSEKAVLLANKILREHAGSALTALSPRAVLILSLTLKAFSASAREKKEQYMMIKSVKMEPDKS